MQLRSHLAHTYAGTVGHGLTRAGKQALTESQQEVNAASDVIDAATDALSASGRQVCKLHGDNNLRVGVRALTQSRPTERRRSITGVCQGTIDPIHERRVLF